MIGRIAKKESTAGRLFRRSVFCKTKSNSTNRVSNSRSRRRRLKRRHSSKRAILTDTSYFLISAPLKEKSEMEVLELDPDRPSCHVMPLKGWMNDPNGPIYYHGRYHLFYQHVRDRVEWDWGLVWAHAISEDLVTWEHLPIALEPSPEGQDSDGCFSGCCVLDHNGVPTLLYTGVKLRSKFKDKSKLPSKECDLQLPFIETQLAAIPSDPNDDCLRHFTREEKPLISLPPPDLKLMGWRDPFMVKGMHNGKHLMLIGSGLKGKGGTVLKYLADDILSEWEYVGTLCNGDADTGAMWECPLLVKLTALNNQFDISSQLQAPIKEEEEEEEGIPSMITPLIHEEAVLPDFTKLKISQTEPENQYLFCVSPDAPTNPVICWLGAFNTDSLEFEIEKAEGPFLLDLGDVIYAPNLMEGPNGEILLWGWIQEKRQVGSYDYSGCLSIPRQLSLREGKLFQQPAGQITGLRTEVKWELEKVPIFSEELLPVDGIISQKMDLEITLSRGSSEATGILIRSWKGGGEGTVAIVFDWEQGCLDVIFEALDPDTMEFVLDSETSRRIGGRLNWKPGTNLTLRILLDHSVLEIFTSTGEVLTTRVYRGAPVLPRDSGIDLVSFGGTTELISATAYELRSIWREDHASYLPIREENKTKVNRMVSHNLKIEQCIVL